MISDKCKTQAAITFVVVMAALAAHQEIIAKRALKSKKTNKKINET